MNARTKIVVSAGFLLLALGGLWAGGAKEVDTVVRMEAGETWISPVSEQPEKRSLSIREIGLQLDPKGVIKQYRFVVFTRAGTPVFEKVEENKEQRTALAEALNIGEVPRVSLPAAMEWKAVDSAGKQVPDGDYLYQISALDSWGGTAISAPLTVVVDTKAPAVTRLALSGRSFSPDGDGKRDTLAIRHVTEPGFSWTLQVLDPAGAVVWDRKWQAQGSSEKDDVLLSGESVWRPLEAAGAVRLPEGRYKVVLTGLDRAGNKTVQQREVEVNYTTGQGALAVEGGRTVFSPREAVVLLPALEDRTGTVSWKLEVQAADGAVWRRLEGQGPAPERISYAGTGQAGLPWADAGRIPDGSYRFVFEQTYDTGAILEDRDLVLDFDATPPEASLKLTLPEAGDTALAAGVASNAVQGRPVAERLPGFGDQARPQVLLETRTGSEAVAWQVVLRPWRQPGTVDAAAGTDQPVSFPLADLLAGGDGSGNVAWDASLPGGQGRLADGLWELFLTGRDAAGNEGQSNVVRFLFAAHTPGAFNFVADRTSLVLAYAETPEAVELRLADPAQDQFLVDWHALVVTNQEGETVYRKALAPGEALRWHGQRSNGLMAPAGNYEARVETTFRNGGLALSAAFPVDLRHAGTGTDAAVAANTAARFLLPRLLVEAPAVVGDGEGTPFSLAVKGLEGSDVQWRLRVRDNAGTELWEASGQGSGETARQWTSPAGLPGTPYEAVLDLAGPDDTRLSLSRQLGTAIPVAREDHPAGQRLRILVPAILFDGNRADSLAADDRLRSANTDLLRRLGTMLRDLTGYRIVIEGHATYVTGTDPASRQQEQEVELLPLSRDRAMEVKKIFFMMGVDWNRMEVAALGGSEPVVDPADAGERWKNRRVSLYLVPEAAAAR